MVSNFQKNKKSGLLLRTRLHIGGVLVLIVLVVLVIANVKLYQKKQVFLSQVAGLENQIKDIEQRNNNLQNGISQSNNDQYIEKVAREQLDLQKPGETAVSFVVSENQTPKVNNTNPGWFGWLGTSWQWLKNKF